MPSVVRAAVCAAVLTLLSPPLGRAATPEDVLFQDIPTVVTPSRLPQKPWHSSSSVEVVTYDTIERWGVRSVADLLRRLAGMDVRQMGYMNLVGSRGTANVTHIHNMLVLIDGVPVTDPIFGNVDLGPDLPLGGIKQVEVVRGPGSSLWGANAYAGTINVITKKPSDQAGSRAGLSVGSHEAVLGSFMHGEPGVGTEWLAGARWTSTDGRDDHSVNQNDYMRDGDVFARLLRGRADVFAFASDSSQGRPGSIITNNPEQYLTNENALLRGSWRFTDSPGHGLVANAVFSRQDGSFPGGPLPRPLRVDFESERAGVSLQWTNELSRRHTMVAGLDYWHKAAEWLDLAGEHSSAERAVYFQDEVRLEHDWTLTVGARFDHDSLFGDMLSPRLAASRRLDARRTLRLSVGRAFRAPNYSEQFVFAYVGRDPVSGLDIRAVGNPSVEPERVLAYQAGFSHNVSSRLRYDVDLFYNRCTDRIGAVLGLAPDFSAIWARVYNEGQSTASGGEFSLRGDLSARARLTFNYSYQHTRDDDTGEELNYTPAHKANATFDVDHGGRFFSSFFLHWVDDRTSEFGTRLDDYVTADLRVGRRHGRSGKGFAALTIYNLFDEDYQETDLYPMAGRTVALEYVTRF